MKQIALTFAQAAAALRRLFRRITSARRASKQIDVALRRVATSGYRGPRTQAALYAAFTAGTPGGCGHSSHSNHGLFQTDISRAQWKWASSLAQVYGAVTAMIVDRRMDFPAGVVAAQNAWEGYE